MKSYNLTIIVEKDEDGIYIGTVPALKACYTQAGTLEELYQRIREVIELCLESQSIEMQTTLVGVQQIEVAI